MPDTELTAALPSRLAVTTAALPSRFAESTAALQSRFAPIHRAKIGVIVPSTNTVVEHDVNAAPLPGITFHAGRMYIADPTMAGDDGFTRLLGQIRASITTAIRDVMTCQPDHLMMGMSAETFWGGVEGNAAFEQRVKEQSGLDCTTGASSVRLALETLGIGRVSFLTPYQPVADAEVRRFLTEAGFEVATFTGLRCPTATSIAEVPPERLREVLAEIDGEGVEALVQVGTNLSMVALADELERTLGKPVIAINAAVLWNTLRTLGFSDQFPGYGQLLREH